MIGKIGSFLQKYRTKTTKKTQNDDSHFTKSFDLDTCNPAELLEFYNKCGFVIFDEVLSDEEVELTIDDLWKDMNEYLRIFNDPQITVDRHNPKTWKNLDYAQNANAYGFVNTEPINQLQCWKNRQNPRVYKAFKMLFDVTKAEGMANEPLISCLDRGSILRPTHENKDWLTKNIYHFDIDPWQFTGVVQKSQYHEPDYSLDNMSSMLSEGNLGRYNGYPKLSAVLALSDTYDNSGGFECSVGFHNRIHEWCETHEYGYNVANDVEITKNMQKLFIRKGSLMIFTRELPHNIYQNRSNKFRYAQYVRMIPLSELRLIPELLEKRKTLIKQILPADLDTSSEISKELFML